MDAQVESVAASYPANSPYKSAMDPLMEGFAPSWNQRAGEEDLNYESSLLRWWKETGEKLQAMYMEDDDSSVFELDVDSSAAGCPPSKIGFIETVWERNQDLRAALEDLRQAPREAREEGYPIPSDLALANARFLLRAAFKYARRRYEIYPTPDAEIAIDASAGRGRSVLLLCESEGGVLCLVNMNGKLRRARFPDALRLPDGFVREALDEMALSEVART